MKTKMKLIGILCLALCLLLCACGDNDQKDDNTPGDNIIYAPTTDDGTKPSDTTNTPNSGEPSDDTKDTEEPDDTTADTVSPPDHTDDTEPSTSDTSEVTEPIEPDGTNEPSDTTTKPSDNTSSEEIDLRGQLSVDYPISGKLVSWQSEKLLLVVNYECVMQISGNVQIDFEVGLETYDINCGERINGGKFSVNGEVFEFSTESIVHEERGKIFVPFAAFTYVSENGEKSCDAFASWFFNGNYAGDKIDYLCVATQFIWD